MSDLHATFSSGREPATVRVAMWSARHRWLVAVLWFVATIGLFVASTAMGGIKALDANTDPNERQLEASEAYDLFNAGGTNDPFEQLVVVIGGAPGAATNDPAFQATVHDVVARLQATHAQVDGADTKSFSQLADPFQAPAEAALISADGSTVRIIGRVDGERPRTSDLLAPVLPMLAEQRAAHPDLAIHAVSST